MFWRTRSWILGLVMVASFPSFQAQLFDFSGGSSAGVANCLGYNGVWTFEPVSNFPPPASGSLSGTVYSSSKTARSCITTTIPITMTAKSKLNILIYVPYTKPVDYIAIYVVNDFDSDELVRINGKNLIWGWQDGTVEIPSRFIGKIMIEIVASSVTMSSSVRYFEVTEQDRTTAPPTTTTSAPLDTTTVPLDTTTAPLDTDTTTSPLDTTTVPLDTTKAEPLDTTTATSLETSELTETSPPSSSTETSQVPENETTETSEETQETTVTLEPGITELSTKTTILETEDTITDTPSTSSATTSEDPLGNTSDFPTTTTTEEPVFSAPGPFVVDDWSIVIGVAIGVLIMVTIFSTAACCWWVVCFKGRLKSLPQSQPPPAAMTLPRLGVVSSRSRAAITSIPSAAINSNNDVWSNNGWSYKK